MPYQTKYAFVPKTDSEFSKLVQTWKQAKTNIVHIQPGDNCLSGVGNNDALYIFGHGNLGKGIGPTKAEAIPAQQLAADLKGKYGLKDVHVTIKLLACNSGVTMPTLEQSYAFAFALAMLPYKNPIIHGYAGFILSPANGHKKSHLQILPPEDDDETGSGLCLVDDPALVKGNPMRRVTFGLSTGEVVQLDGLKWVGEYKESTKYPGNMMYDIHQQ